MNSLLKLALDINFVVRWHMSSNLDDNYNNGVIKCNGVVYNHIYNFVDNYMSLTKNYIISKWFSDHEIMKLIRILISNIPNK